MGNNDSATPHGSLFAFHKEKSSLPAHFTQHLVLFRELAVCRNPTPAHHSSHSRSQLGTRTPEREYTNAHNTQEVKLRTKDQS